MLAATRSARIKLCETTWSLHGSHSLFFSSLPTGPEPPLSETRTSFTPTTSRLERLIGYPTPLLSLRHLLGNELSHLSGQARRLLASRHPIVERSRSFLNSSSHSPLHTQGMLTLLVAKVFNLVNPVLSGADQFGILPSQRVLAEVTEMIDIAHLIHQEVVDLGRKEEREAEEEEESDGGDLSFGNKMVILGGDILLARACKELSLLYKPQVVSLMSQGISSIMEDTFTSQDNLDGREKGRSRRQPLLASSCHSCAIVAQLAPSIQRQSSCLGSYLSLLMELSKQAHLNERARDECYHVSKQALAILEGLPDSEPKLVLSEYINSKM